MKKIEEFSQFAMTKMATGKLLGGHSGACGTGAGSKTTLDGVTRRWSNDMIDSNGNTHIPGSRGEDEASYDRLPRC
jgi:hypothetical protein